MACFVYRRGHKLLPFSIVHQLMIYQIKDEISVSPSPSQTFEKLNLWTIIQVSWFKQALICKSMWFLTLHLAVCRLLNSTNDCCVIIDRGQYIAMIFIDIKTAFDTVDRRILLNKMWHCGIGLEQQRSLEEIRCTEWSCNFIAWINLRVMQSSSI